MTHGDKAKAKAGNKSQASAKARGAKGGQNGKGGGAKSGAKAGKAETVAHKKVAAEKGGRPQTAAATKERGSEAETRGKARSDGASITDSRVATAFKHAVKKYPNAFRKLTD